MNAIVERIERAVSPEQVNQFQHELAKLPQFEPRTEHYFANGMYCRKCYLPAGTLFVGKIQRHEHFFMIVQGWLDVYHEGGIVAMQEGTVVVSSPGTRRIGVTYEDTIAVTVHRTDKTDLDEIEKEIIQPDPESPCFFDARNQLKTPELTDGGVK